MTTVLTIGHGTRTIADVIEMLHAAGAGKVVDVRRFPASRRHPHFARAALEASLPAASIGYEWRGDALGGRRTASPGHTSRHHALRVAAFRAYADHMDTREFRAALEQLETEAADERITLMCAETLWWRCHRRLIADALVMDGLDVVHLIDGRTTHRHSLHEVARRDERGRPAYDVGRPPQR